MGMSEQYVCMGAWPTDLPSVLDSCLWRLMGDHSSAIAAAATPNSAAHYGGDHLTSYMYWPKS